MLYSLQVKDQRMHFSASHFLRFCGDCEHLHGHNYGLKVFITGPLNEDGMVVNFKEIKERAIEICKTLDHKVMLPGDSSSITINSENGFIEVIVASKRYVFPEEDCMLIPTQATTTELLAKYIHGHLKYPSDYRVRVCVSENAGSTGCYEE
jgi:6-pyruvoyltetrahydropterin/6-carboxytetrahydropterin synthase